MISTYRSPVFASADHTQIDCTVVLVTGETIPFTAWVHDPNAQGKALYEQIMANAHAVPIGPYVARPVPAGGKPKVVA